MIRANLATRPFYNERLVNLWVLLSPRWWPPRPLQRHPRAVDSGSNTELASQAAQNVARAANFGARPTD